MKFWRRKSCCAGLSVGVVLTFIGALWLVLTVMKVAYSRHEIGTYEIGAGARNLRIPFAGQKRPFLIFDVLLPDSETRSKELPTEFDGTTVSISAIRDGHVLDAQDFGATNGLSRSRMIDEKGRRGLSLKMNLSRELFEGGAGGVDELRVALDEGRTSLPRPLTVRVFYIH